MLTIKNIFFTFIVCTILALHPSLNKGKSAITYLQYLVYGNSINLTYDKIINKDKINVEWECENQDVDCIELTIIKNGKQINSIPFAKGNQKLVVYYNGLLVGTLHQYKSYDKQANKYDLALSSDLKTLTFKGNIEGPSPSSFFQTIKLNTNILASIK